MQVRTLDNNVGFETFNQNNPAGATLVQIILRLADHGKAWPSRSRLA